MPPIDAREPLRAARKPLETRKPAQRKGFLRTYGWRVYALPVLAVVTVLVGVQSATAPAPSAQQPAGSPPAGTAPVSEAAGPGVRENPAAPVDLNGETAVLPNGGDFTLSGKGNWHVVPGSGEKIGTGRLYRYTVEVEDGIDPSSYAGDDSFASAVQGTLSDAKSWTADGKLALQRVDGSSARPDFRVSLTTPDTTHRPDTCGFSITYEASCFRSSKHRVLINLARWVRGAKAYGPNLSGYRVYAINHEVGHALGHSHVGCGGDGQPAPVMMQQSFGVADDYVARLNDVPGGDQGAVPADHRTCVTNEWPFPDGH
ncbi:DUF3152 domain-containing protein [Amycolatopsis saalfeldensis]|uniref:DUF3152 domain-containing protein n=1 Tax=Amycolatopsis saalfeldensis TaxID=394193 RepID=UPI000A46F231|nr:DUF3152 domain-containing protein [Amycolatopsis saalfeldensis]